MSKNTGGNRRMEFPRPRKPVGAVVALDPRIGDSPRGEDGRSSLPRQTPPKTEDGVRAQLLEKIGQAGVDAIFAVAQKSRRRVRKPVRA